MSTVSHCNKLIARDVEMTHISEGEGEEEGKGDGGMEGEKEKWRTIERKKDRKEKYLKKKRENSFVYLSFHFFSLVYHTQRQFFHLFSLALVLFFFLAVYDCPAEVLISNSHLVNCMLIVMVASTFFASLINAIRNYFMALFFCCQVAAPWYVKSIAAEF